ncbi:MAG: ABC transporter ATP-binding protein [Gammaproteobacteria bacterium]
MAAISVEHVSKKFADAHVLQDLSLTIADGEFVALLGPSGCGKSTLLRIISGLEQPDGGVVRIGNRDVTSLDPATRNLAFVFQSYALYPHKSVYENVAFPLLVRSPWRARVPLLGLFSPARRAADQALRKKVETTASQLGLKDLLARKPGQLSGGQRQRVALARALVRDPQAFLLDEPLSNLDARLRATMCAELVELHQRLGATFVYVTHDQAEAMSMADRIVLLNAGSIQQQGPPATLYDDPVNRFVAGFIGAPSINFLPFRVDSQCRGTLGPGIPTTLPDSIDRVRVTPGQQGEIGIRPQAIALTAAEGPGSLRATVRLIEPHGDATFLTVALTGAPTPPELRVTLRAEPDETRGLKVGAPVGVRFDWSRALLFDASGQRGNRAVKMAA